MSGKQKYKRDSFMRKEREVWNRGKQIQMSFTLVESLAGTDKG